VLFPSLFLWEAFGGDLAGWGPDCANPISASTVPEDSHRSGLLMVTFASLFGAMHFITWSFSMPTLTELWMWRSASIALTSLPVLATLSYLVMVSVEDHSFLWDSMGFLTLTAAALHPLIRLLITVDSIVLLRDLPDTAYLVLSWSDAIPSL